jgi:hypothetical protein
MKGTRYFKDMLNVDEMIADMKEQGLIIMPHEIDMVLAEAFDYLGPPEPFDRCLFGYMMGLETVISRVIFDYYDQGATLGDTDVRTLVLYHQCRQTERFQKAVLREREGEPWLFETNEEEVL